ncbi:hypothetical protein FIBSPDRAFT_589270 [Athelia psychrophila]|uniref:F-box domain-containing protein n=1 Tax=Athelia psychrophila TaxID=1759441 RepID=A0A166H7A0_9AGAM|nr:hypothetical protein FIBSPDRAFT_589270 [Fibularhizoctonia sp. CBS 109695]
MLTEVLPTEIIEHIALELDPVDVAAIGQTSRFLRSFVYNTEDDHLWRSLYLKQPFDDPRTCINFQGEPQLLIDWKGELQQIIRARTILRRYSRITDSTLSSACPPAERRSVLESLWRLASNAPLAPVAFSDVPDNLAWVTRILRSCEFLAEPAQPDDLQLQKKLHTHCGLVSSDINDVNLFESRAYCYDLRNYTHSPQMGPFLSDGRVNWVHMKALHHVISIRISNNDPDFLLTKFPMSLVFCQPVRAGVDELAEDWVGISAGAWKLVQCHCDPLQMDVYNNPMGANEDSRFEERLRAAGPVRFRVTSTEADPEHPTRPIINFTSGQNPLHIKGYIRMTPDSQVRWHLAVREMSGQMWSAEGINMGGLRSVYGVLGSWVLDDGDAVGPIWLRRQY